MAILKHYDIILTIIIIILGLILFFAHREAKDCLNDPIGYFEKETGQVIPYNPSLMIPTTNNKNYTIKDVIEVPA